MQPNGAARSYTSKPEFVRKAEARVVDMGAIDFIKHGSPEAGSVQEPWATDAEEVPAVKEIEHCCVQWRAGRVELRWIFLIDSKPAGCARSPPLNLTTPFFLTTFDFDFDLV
jgi:hypothetical protein